MSIPFTQFLMPDGRQQPVTIDRPEEIEAKARELIKLGYRFEIEMLTTGEISIECCTPDGEESLAQEICPNGPPVCDAVDNVVNDAHNARQIVAAE